MNNNWNKFIYKLWSPVYDKFFNAGIFYNARKKLFEDAIFQQGQKVLFVGVGTGADLEFIHQEGIEITAIDFSADMLKKAKERFGNKSSITFLEMDAQQLKFPDEMFDVVVASLILSVVPDANRCMKEMIRVTRKKGHILIFDKFAPKNEKLPIGKRLIRPVISLLGTDIGLSYEKIIESYGEQVIERIDTPLMFGGMFRKINVVRVG